MNLPPKSENLAKLLENYEIIIQSKQKEIEDLIGLHNTQKRNLD